MPMKAMVSMDEAEEEEEEYAVLLRELVLITAALSMQAVAVPEDVAAGRDMPVAQAELPLVCLLHLPDVQMNL